MFKYKIISISLLVVFIGVPAYCQGKSEDHQIKMTVGTVINVDAVGNVITIQTPDQKQMTFFVPDKVNITQQTHDIGLMDIRATDPVTVQYYIPSAGKYTIFSIVDNKPVASP